jgi:hypothetical protein
MSGNLKMADGLLGGLKSPPSDEASKNKAFAGGISKIEAGARRESARSFRKRLESSPITAEGIHPVYRKQREQEERRLNLIRNYNDMIINLQKKRAWLGQDITPQQEKALEKKLKSYRSFMKGRLLKLLQKWEKKGKLLPDSEWARVEAELLELREHVR